MTTILDPGKGARRQAREQRKLLAKQKQKQQLEKAEAEGELAIVKSRLSPAKGRQSLITGTQKRDQLG